MCVYCLWSTHVNYHGTDFDFDRHKHLQYVGRKNDTLGSLWSLFAFSVWAHVHCSFRSIGGESQNQLIIIVIVVFAWLLAVRPNAAEKMIWMHGKTTFACRRSSPLSSC